MEVKILKSILLRAALVFAFVAFAAKVQAQVDVWMDLNYPGTEIGTQTFPFDTLGEALSEVSAGGTVHLGPGDSHETLVINQQVRLEVSGGTARFGVLSSPLGSGAPLEWLRIMEIMYNPGDGGAEFLELQNTGPNALDLSGVYFSKGIGFTFPGSTTINAGEIFVLVRDTDQTAYNILYAMTPDGVYTGALSNNGEIIALSTPGGIEFLSLTYNNTGSWPSQADGQGWSLVILDPQGNGSDPANWGSASSKTARPALTKPIPISPWTTPNSV